MFLKDSIISFIGFDKLVNCTVPLCIVESRAVCLQQWPDKRQASKISNCLFVNVKSYVRFFSHFSLDLSGEMYYYAFKSIPPGTEFLVWYGEAYRKYLKLEQFAGPDYYYASRECDAIFSFHNC